MEDYALSAEAMVRLLEHLKAEYPDSVEEVERHAPAVLQVMPETMEEFLFAIGSRYGSYQGLAQWLGVADAVDRLRRAVLVPPEPGVPPGPPGVSRGGPSPASRGLSWRSLRRSLPAVLRGTDGRSVGSDHVRLRR